MKYTIRGQGDAILTPDDFIWGGGEGDVYGKGNLVYKIYHDPKKMIPEGKMQDLASLDRNNILRPLDTLMQGNQRVGFTMKRVRDTHPLCKLFVPEFCITNNVTNDIIIKLIEEMKKTIEFIHRKDCLIVDGNEFNYLVSSDFKIPYFIDVDSYQTKHGYPATAIMISIRDWHSNEFTNLSDWFAFAIIACQLMTKMHPFKGKRNEDANIPEEERMPYKMKHNLSIFNRDTRVRSIIKTRIENDVPRAYKDWFIALFEKGERILPPDLITSVVIQRVKQIFKGSEAFEISKVLEEVNNILYYSYCCGLPIVKTDSEIVVRGRNFSVSRDVEVVLSNQQLTPIFIKIENERLKLNAGTSILPIDVQCSEKMIVDNTLYVKNGGNLIELRFDDSGTKIIPSIKVVWNIMPNSSIIFSNVIYQSVLGKPYLVIPRPRETGNSLCYILPIKELEGYRIVSAKHDNNVCILIGHKNNTYDRIVLKFTENYNSYDCKIVKDVDSQSVNFVTLDNGVVINLCGDCLELFSKNPNNPHINILENTDLTEVKLIKNGNQAMFIKNNKVFTISMKKKI